MFQIQEHRDSGRNNKSKRNDHRGEIADRSAYRICGPDGRGHPAYVGTHTDRRLFIADAGNARIVNVRLDYHVNETVALKDVPDKE